MHLTGTPGILQSTAGYLLARLKCRLFKGFLPAPPAAPDYGGVYRSPQYRMLTAGDCDQGSYIETYVPDNPWLADDGSVRAIVFLHGFALGASQIYRAHLLHLVRQGIYCFYPNYQTGFCSFPSTPWRTFGELAREVIGDGLIDSQLKWLRNALASVSGAYERTGLGAQTQVQTTLYGHSLGGLFALSWPYYVGQDGLPSWLLPRQVVAADPIPSTAISSVPGPLGKLLRRLTDDVDIRKTGRGLTVPVAILHGAADWVVPKAEWREPFRCIASEHKAMYLSFTDTHGCPGHFANHEQATNDTGFFPPLLALLMLDGVGTLDDLDWRYVWYALDQAVAGGAPLDRLDFDLGHWSDGRPVRPVRVYLRGSRW